MYIVVLSDSYICICIISTSLYLHHYILLFIAGTLCVYNVDMFLEDILRVAKCSVQPIGPTPSKFQVGRRRFPFSASRNKNPKTMYVKGSYQIHIFQKMFLKNVFFVVVESLKNDYLRSCWK